MTINYITLGSDCSTASALRTLELRDFALPFDWIVSSKISLINCINDDFKCFHSDLRFNKKKTRLIDKYGFEFA